MLGYVGMDFLLRVRSNPGAFPEKANFAHTCRLDEAP